MIATDNNNSGDPNCRFIQSFGRRRSHGLSTMQKKILHDFYELYGIALPESERSPSEFFRDRIFSKIFFEIGFGAGEHLIQEAMHNPDIGFIGCEPFENGVAKVLREIHDNGLSNIRIFNGDARFLLHLCRNSSIDRFYVLFPDPWTKIKHHKRRLVSKGFITPLLYSRLRPHGDIIIATDCENYMKDIVEQVKDCSQISLSSTELSQLKRRPINFTATRYEQKAIQQGKQPFYLQIEKVGV